MSSNYLRVVYFAALAIAGLCAYAIGVRGVAWFVVTCVGGILGNVALLIITVRLFPPELEVTGEYRGILYGDPSTRCSEQRTAPDNLESNTSPHHDRETRHRP